ncbi:MAG: hypothetical protein JWR80_8030 [Bradyrhizobium sp.]|nr:hypothetical protein [Bradyrhizobium sp.]
MRKPLQPRRHGVPKLSDYAGGKIAVACSKCGMQRRYDADAMFERIGDFPMPLLLIEIAMAEGCPLVGRKSGERCMLGYDLSYAPMFKGK